MKSKLVLNLRNCQYDLFKTIAIEELGWRVIDKNCNVYDPMNAAEILKAKEMKMVQLETTHLHYKSNQSKSKNQKNNKKLIIFKRDW